MVVTLILVRDNNGDMHDKEGHLHNAAEANIDRPPSPPIDRRALITYRVQMPKIDVARLSTLMPKPKPSEQPPEPVITLSDDGDDPMEEDTVTTGGTLRRRKKKSGETSEEGG
uniref:Uncharacterized protein n=1 Tax=Brassica campestris TaxID=3711 RepID=M4F1N2_BRACM